MKFPTLIVTGLALTAACFFVRIFEPPFLEAIALKTYDLMLSHAHDEPRSGRVSIVDLDEASLRQFGQWPWPRYRVAQLTENIFKAGASVVAFDIVFAEKDRTSPRVLRDALSNDFPFLRAHLTFDEIPPELMDFDELLARSLALNSNSVLGCWMDQLPASKRVEVLEAELLRARERLRSHGATNALLALEANRGTNALEQHLLNAIDGVAASSDPFYRGQVSVIGPATTNGHDFLLQARDVLVSIPQLSAAAGNNAFFNSLPDRDSIVRSVPLVWDCGSSHTYASLAMAALRRHLNAPNILVQYDEDGVVAARIQAVEIPTDKNCRITVNYRRGKMVNDLYRSMPWVSAADVLNGALPSNTFANQIVFIGTSATGLRDLRATPLAAEFAGVEIHATVIDNILAGDVLINPSWMVYVDEALILCVGVFLTLLLAKSRALTSMLVTMLVIVLAAWSGLVLLRQLHVVFVPARLVLSALLIYMALTMIRYWQEEKQKRQVRNMFGTMVSPEVLQYLENHPGSFSLTGQKTEATMFFSDVAGFTTISENLEPEKLGALLNRYLSPMTTVIMNRRGYVDKYEGDAIMAEWGVPFPVEDHAIQACLAALEQQETLDVLRPLLKKEFGYDLFVRMGLNSGRVTAGNMGSARRQQFTVMGDAVNQAARLEPVNKDYGTRIVIGEATYELAQAAIEARLLDRIVVVGKTKPVHIYELLAQKGQVAGAKRDAVAFYEEALKLHWARQWESALQRLERALVADTNDTPSRRLGDRIRLYQQQPPPDGWAGEFRRAGKD